MQIFQVLIMDSEIKTNNVTNSSSDHLWFCHYIKHCRKKSFWIPMRELFIKGLVRWKEAGWLCTKVWSSDDGEILLGKILRDFFWFINHHLHPRARTRIVFGSSLQQGKSPSTVVYTCPTRRFLDQYIQFHPCWLST